MNQQGNATIERKEIFGHPVGLFVLFFTELWERFSYYGMRAILVLYMISSISSGNSGLGWTEGNALALYGWYTMLVYIMSIPGGIIADKFLGQKKTVLLGGLLLCAGHGILAVEAEWAFYTGLLLIVLGVGGLKPNISTMVGGLYPPGDERRDNGFTIFYIGINIGALMASLIVGYIGETIGWHYGFGLAGIGMLVGQIVYMAGQKHLKGVGEPPSLSTKDQSVIHADAQGENTSLGELFSNLLSSPTQLVITLTLVAAGIAFAVTGFEGYEMWAYSALFTFLGLAAGLMMMIYKDVNSIEKDRFIVLLLSFIIVIVFWGAFEQAGGLMNIYTKQKIDRTLFGLEIPASVFQSVNPFFIIVFGTIVANFWLWWKHRGKESSSLFKMAMGTIIMGVGFIFMGIASKEASSGVGEKGMLIWLILAYLFHTIGELSASPVALSFITKIAPVKYVSIMMGFYFAATGLGNKVAGSIGEASQAEPIVVELQADGKALTPYLDESGQTGYTAGENFRLTSEISVQNGQVILSQEGKSLNDFFNIEAHDNEELVERINESGEQNLTAVMDFDKQANGDYAAEVEIFELQNKQEFMTFVLIFVFTAAFGLILLIFLKKLKRLTHGAEDLESTHHEEQENYEISDKEGNDKN